MNNQESNFWAKTFMDSAGSELPGISVFDHCVNVGCVAWSILNALPRSVRLLLPGLEGQSTPLLAALHDIGKVTLGFQTKCPAWSIPAELGGRAGKEAAFSVSDHALVSQVFLQDRLKSSGAHPWAVAIGAHHGRPKGQVVPRPLEAQSKWAELHRIRILSRLVEVFGPLPEVPPIKRFGTAHSDLWLMAGLITVADWVGSDEQFFPPDRGLPLAEAKQRSRQALATIGWPGGGMVSTSFSRAFTGQEDVEFRPNAIQEVVATAPPGLVIVEAPMGCGKTEAALHLAQKWIAEGSHHGLYFALPTQVTSNRIHIRVAALLRNTLSEPARLRLAHGHAWLEDVFDLGLRPSRMSSERKDDDYPDADVREARSWFASGKRALLAPYGVGTIDQALQGLVIVKHFFVRRFALAGKVVILDEIHSYDVYTGTLVGALVRELLNLGCSVIVLSATLTAARRRELLQAAGCNEPSSPDTYPLVTFGRDSQTALHHAPAWTRSRSVRLRAEGLSEDAILDELVSRAEAGQHVLWIRNTVIEAQQTFATLRGMISEGGARIGLLHSRFPFVRRQELESDWLGRLGRNRPSTGPGSILIATQVVEQSVDIDLDFIVSDLAPTDMLLQRMGRLWRHDRPSEHRPTGGPEFWVRLPDIDQVNIAKALKVALGRSARVYAPFVLLRTARIWRAYRQIRLPEDIRPLLEATYADSSSEEPLGWRALLEELEAEKRTLQANAEAAMRVFGLPMLDPDADGALTRRKGPPTVPMIILSSVNLQPSGKSWQLTAPNGTTVTISDFDWSLAAARFLHRWLVQVPKWQVPPDAPRPRWLTEHVGRDAVLACLEEDGRLRFEHTPGPISYHPDFGVFAERPAKSQSKPEPWTDNDDEFDL